MDSFHTQRQSVEEQSRARELSRQRAVPPAEIPGYEIRRFLGAGAYGEVWVAVAQNTGRLVAIKFYTHRSGVDWSLLSREVEKLVFLSADRYVVQLLEVGWDAEPPYYVMEHMENGSLEQYLAQRKTLPLGQAVEIFREVATGLSHAHDKGVLHCDLKPANILLDQDFKPRLADFGQSRLTHEQRPALGTLYYMAPEQADLEAVPDAAWDVYALGALLFCMLTGEPPHRRQSETEPFDATSSLEARLASYRQRIRELPPPAEHRKVPKIDRALVEIIDRCLAVNPEQRFRNVQSVLNALRARDVARDLRPLMVMGMVGPLLLLAVMTVFAVLGYQRATRESDRMLADRALETNRFNAKFVAEAVARRIDRYFRAVEQRGSETALLAEVQAILENSELSGSGDGSGTPGLLDRLKHTPPDDPQRAALVQEFVDHPARQRLQDRLDEWVRQPRGQQVASWFVVDRRGIHLAAAFAHEDAEDTVGKDYAYRTYFHGMPDDLEPSAETPTPPPIERTHLSSVFQSTATKHWKVAISTPLRVDGRIVAVLALTVDIGRVVDFTGGNEHLFTVLVDGREGSQRGVILEHPLYKRLLRTKKMIPSRFSETYRVRLDGWQNDGKMDYIDPLAADPEGQEFDRRWVAAKQDVRMRAPDQPLAQDVDTGWVVIVQEDYASIIGPVEALGQWLVAQGMLALASFAAVVVLLWYAVRRLLRDPDEWVRRQRHHASLAALHRSSETLPLHHTSVSGDAADRTHG